ncbi:MAG: hypothetical protein JWQ28_1136 [Pedobacter sp.]|jgi:hypothetical protein|nr:hypothetical protein [Pedobacter sp.]
MFDSQNYVKYVCNPNIIQDISKVININAFVSVYFTSIPSIYSNKKLDLLS